MPTRPAPVIVRPGELWFGARPAGGSFAARATLAPPSLLSSPLAVFCVDTTTPRVALTFDDGPAEDTPRILDVLAEHGATATFFVLSDQVERFSETARRIVSDGHELALHGRDHAALTSLTDREALSRIRRAREVVERTTGERIQLFRPPYGRNTWGQALGLRRMGLRNVLWSSEAYDWVDDEPAAIAQRALDGAFPGGIVLLHDHRADPETLEPGKSLPAFDRAEVVRMILTGLEERGLSTTTAGQLIRDHREVRSFVRDLMRREKIG